jgi:high affinity choline transporter 7
MIARNFYQKVIRPKASEKEVIYALWVCICINCIIATSLAIEYKSIYELFVLCGDFMFVIVFPQLTLVIYWEMANTYGSVTSFIIGIILRLLCGDSLMGIPATISFGTVYGEEGSCPTDADPLAACTGPVPFRLIVTIIGTLVHILFSYGAYTVFARGWVSLDYDFFNCFKRDQDGELVLTGSRHMETENYQLDDLKIPRPKVEYIGSGGEEKGAYKNSGYN